MLVQAMDSFQVAKRQHKENVKSQHTAAKGNKGEKTFFRASELGSDDRKIIYGFFAHQLPKIERGAKNLRQLENGDYVHERYQTAWEEMGVLVSMEQRLTSRNDEYLSQFPWEWAGHYDGELDMNIVRAHALGFAKVESVFNEESNKWEIVVEIDDAYANSIGLFDEEGNISADYEASRPRMVADIKTMNPWGFKRVKEQHDVSDIQGYIDQISFYMYMLGTPYGSIYIESKDNNDVVEVQIVWTDFYEGVTLGFDTNIHGEQTADQVRVTIDSGRFFGDDTREGVVPRITRLHNVVEELRKAEEAGDRETIARIVPNRCADKPDAFPCSWGHRQGKPQYCEFYDHCWSAQHHGLAISTAPAFEACPEELVWKFEDELEDGTTSEVRVDSRKVPQGVDYEGFLTLVGMGALDYTKFLVDEAPEEGTFLPASVQAEIAAAEAEKTALNGTKNLFGEGGELNIGAPTPATEAEEYIVDGKKAIKCTNCHKEVTYTRLGNGGTKKCDHCSHVNKVIKL